MITIKTDEEISVLREGGNILAAILKRLDKETVPGISADKLNNLAITLIRQAGGEPSFLGYRPAEAKEGYPAGLCVSVNSEVVHGLPWLYSGAQKILKEGDIVGLDLGLKYKNLYTDMAITVPVGRISPKKQNLIKIARQSIEAGIRAIKPGGHVGDIGDAIQSFVEEKNFSVVKKLVGHGVGFRVHEDPEIPNFGRRGEGPLLKQGMVLALEPMITLGNPGVRLLPDNWTWKTVDGSSSAHFEHTVVVTKTGAEILTLVLGHGVSK
jgi:methionyl aminopeptidase